jgi:hypothetical protein
MITWTSIWSLKPITNNLCYDIYFKVEIHTPRIYQHSQLFSQKKYMHHIYIYHQLKLFN